MVVCYGETNQMPSVQSEGGALAEALNASALVEQFLSAADIARSTKETYKGRGIPDLCMFRCIDARAQCSC